MGHTTGEKNNEIKFRCRMRPEILSWRSLKTYKILPLHTEMISLDGNLKTNKTYSDVGGQHSLPDI